MQFTFLTLKILLCVILAFSVDFLGDILGLLGITVSDSTHEIVSILFFALMCFAVYFCADDPNIRTLILIFIFLDMFGKFSDGFVYLATSGENGTGKIAGDIILNFVAMFYSWMFIPAIFYRDVIMQKFCSIFGMTEPDYDPNVADLFHIKVARIIVIIHAVSTLYLCYIGAQIWMENSVESNENLFRAAGNTYVEIIYYCEQFRLLLLMFILSTVMKKRLDSKEKLMSYKFKI